MNEFDLSKMPSQSGRTAIVTGANVGLGYETALMLAERGASVVLACRNKDKAEAARAKIKAQVPSADIEVALVDLASLASVRDFASAFRAGHERLDLLINNAGIMWAPYGKTVDGFESHLGANFLGHFLLTSLLLDLMPDTSASRVVTLSSNTHKQGVLRFDDLHLERGYSKMGAYAQSKLACLVFTLELQRRLSRSGKKMLSVAAHPGASLDTGLIKNQWLKRILLATFQPFMGNSTRNGALATVMAALDPNVKGGDYYGPLGVMEMAGKPGKARPTRAAQDEASGKRLWEAAVKLTNAQFNLEAGG